MPNQPTRDVDKGITEDTLDKIRDLIHAHSGSSASSEDSLKPGMHETEELERL